MTADMSRWCVGWRRTPHVPDVGLVTVQTDRGPVALCRPCWHRWRHDEPTHPHQGEHR